MLNEINPKLISTINFWLKLCQLYNDRYMTHPATKIRVSAALIIINEHIKIFDNIKNHYSPIGDTSLFSLRTDHAVFDYFPKEKIESGWLPHYQMKGTTDLMVLTSVEKIKIFNVFKKTERLSYVDFVNIGMDSLEKQITSRETR